MKSMTTNWGSMTLGLEGVSFEDYNNMIAAHHEQIHKVQGRVGLATTLAQAITRRTWEATHDASDFRVGDWVIKHQSATNRLLPHFIGPFRVTEVLPGDNLVRLAHYLSPTTVEDPVHIARLLHYNMDRTTPLELAQFQLGEGSAVVEAVLGHRSLESGAIEYEIKWLGHPIPLWTRSSELSKVIKVIEYCRVNGLAPPGKEVLRVRDVKPTGRGRSKR